MESAQKLSVQQTPIAGLVVVKIDVHDDDRGWFKENWNRERMIGSGLPDLGPVQNNISFNRNRGTTRGFHAEPWDKYISVGSGSVFGAWIDLRSGVGFGKTYFQAIDPSVAVFVPRGIANAFQTLEDNTVYTYLVNDHWSPEAKYVNVNLADPTLEIDWPIALADAVISKKDLHHPALSDVEPIAPKKTLIIGAGGQLGTALRAIMPTADALDLPEFNIAKPEHLSKVPWKEFDVVINASAFTNVDGAETIEGRREAWAINAHAVADLAKLAIKHRFTLVHVSTDYVFDGEDPEYDDGHKFSPLNVYGASKAAGDLTVSMSPRHYIVRTSWLIGEGKNFFTKMLELAEGGENPSVVDDQFGRITYAKDLAAGIKNLLEGNAPFGTYNLTSDGEITTWFEQAQKVFDENGYDTGRVSPVTTAEYLYKNPKSAPRPRRSILKNSLGKFF